METVLAIAAWLAAAFITVIFVDSLRYKFTGHETPKYIFRTLKEWSGISLFYPAGPWIIGAGELVASVLLILAPAVFAAFGDSSSVQQSRFLGALIAIIIMSGAIFFHLFSPLGVRTPTKWEHGKPVKTSPALFYSALACWACAAFILFVATFRAPVAL